KASRTGRCRAARFRERKPTMTENEDRQVREVLKEVYAAWEGNDADAFAEPDTASRAADLGAVQTGWRLAGPGLAQLAGAGEPRCRVSSQRRLGGAGRHPGWPWCSRASRRPTTSRGGTLRPNHEGSTTWRRRPADCPPCGRCRKARARTGCCCASTAED